MTIQIENFTEAVGEYHDEQRELNHDLGFDSETLQEKYYMTSRSSTTKLQWAEDSVKTWLRMWFLFARTPNRDLIWIDWVLPILH